MKAATLLGLTGKFRPRRPLTTSIPLTPEEIARVDRCVEKVIALTGERARDVRTPVEAFLVARGLAAFENEFGV